MQITLENLENLGKFRTLKKVMEEEERKTRFCKDGSGKSKENI